MHFISPLLPVHRNRSTGLCRSWVKFLREQNMAKNVQANTKFGAPTISKMQRKVCQFLFGVSSRYGESLQKIWIFLQMDAEAYERMYGIRVSGGNTECNDDDAQYQFECDNRKMPKKPMPPL